ncbi:SAM-dependent methyltransferase [Pseudoalteromonas sp. S327]|uniref:methyltransferase domain-containing protein n=1 Tax=unclassified Pseudoalteromonas TaxID=194690 RepID=UPI00110B1C7C|nr:MULTISPECIES: methyltransferase domain-containing protein [unclassified Pseudoalteromonas]TMO05173.1 SAM-dependent methyltransferase [Pseudoalteromonas sp. S327]TMO20325.1 SAM-dependent methyltransferase [Pseudoalteromonas sp. S326]
MIAQALAHTHSKQALNKKPALLPINGASQKRALIQSAEQVRPHTALKKGANDKFSKAAEQYNSHANVQKQAASDLFKLINSQSHNQSKCCVDLGAGPLVNTSQLSKQYGQVIAIDLSLNMLKSAALTNPKICADMDNLPLQANSIDAIFSNFAVQWSANFEKLMQALYKSLKPGGQAYISTVVAGSLNEIKTAFAALDNRSHINTFNTHAYINQSVQKAGFSINSSQKVIYTDCYSSPLKAIKSIKAIGATTQNHANSRQGLLTKSALQRVCNAYPLLNNQACVSYHVVLLSLQKSHE